MAREKKSIDPLAPRVTKVTKPKAKTISRTKSATKQAFKSSEKVSESDLESDENEKPSKPVQLSDITGNETQSSPKLTNKAPEKVRKESPGKDALKPKSKAKQSVKVPVTSKPDLSEDESSSNNSDSSDSDSDELKKASTNGISKNALLKITNGVKSASTDESSEDESSSDEDEKTAAFIKPVTNGACKSQQNRSVEISSSEEGLDSDIDESSSKSKFVKKLDNSVVKPKLLENSQARNDTDFANDEDSSDEEEVATAPLTRVQQQDSSEESEDEGSSSPDRTTNARTIAVQARPTRDFRPPSGFKLIDPSSNTSSGTTSLFKPSSTIGKQIWYISAPSSLPITALKSVALDKFAMQEPIMTHEGAHYALVSDPSASATTRVLLPGKNGYSVLSTKVNNVLQFQQVVQLPTAPRAQNSVPSNSTGTLPDAGVVTKPKKQQPKGLKMRFRPTGFGDGDLGAIGSSDEEEARPRPVFRVLETTSLKRKDRESEKTEKKRKRKSQEDVVEKNAKYSAEATKAIAKDQPTVPAEVTIATPKKKSKNDKGAGEVTNGTSSSKNDKKVENAGEVADGSSSKKDKKREKKHKEKSH